MIPCHNEASTVGQLVTALLDAYGDYIHEVVVVDDSSTDETADVVRGPPSRSPAFDSSSEPRTRASAAR